MDAARTAIKDNRKSSSNGNRFWELSGGIAWCGLCGAQMRTTVVSRSNGQRYFYYRCRRRMKFNEDGCPRPANYATHRVEPAVWEFVSELLKDPERLREDLERMIELEREGMRGDPEREAKVWLDKLSEVDGQRRRAQDLAIEGMLDHEELRAKLATLEETRETARQELEALSRHRERIQELERDKDVLLDAYFGMAPEALETLTPEERHHLYRMLRLRVVMHPDAPPEVSGTFGGGGAVSKLETTSTL